MSVLYIHRSEQIGGGNRVLLGIFERLDRKRFNPVAVLPRGGPLEAELRARDVPYAICDVVGPVTTGGKFAQLSALALLARLIRKHRVDLLHSNTAISYYLPSLAAWTLRVKRVCHLHGAPAVGVLERCLRVAPHAVIACSHGLLRENANLLEHICPTALQRTVVNGVDTDVFRPAEASADLAEELGLAAGERVVSIVAQISEWKGHSHFLEMAQAIAGEFHDVRFLIVGVDAESGAYQRQMEQLAGELGVASRVSFLGFRADVADIIRASDLIVLPSRGEGLPMSLLEASACAKPIVAYRAPGVDEVVIDGLNGLLTPRSVVSLTEAVRRLLVDRPLRERMGKAGREQVESTYSLAAQVHGIEGVYNELLAGGFDRQQRPYVA